VDRVLGFRGEEGGKGEEGMRKRGEDYEGGQGGSTCSNSYIEGEGGSGKE